MRFSGKIGVPKQTVLSKFESSSISVACSFYSAGKVRIRSERYLLGLARST